MRKAFPLLSFLLAVCMLSCTGGRSADMELAEAYTPTEAKGFVIDSVAGGRSTMITVRNPWQGADSVVTSLFIARDGASAPDGYDGQVLNGEARRIVAMSSTQVAMLDAIGEIDRVVGVSGADFISNSHISNGEVKVADVGFDGNVNYELLVSLSPDLVLLYGVNGASTMEGKLRELGIPYMYVGDYLEESPLGKAEWMVAIAETVGKRDVAATAYAAIADRYNTLRDLVKGTPAEGRPKAMLNLPYGDSWFMPPTESYLPRLISDAGGDYIYKEYNGSSSVPIDMEKAYMLASQADVWLNTGSCRSLAELKSAVPKFANVPAVRDARVFNNINRTTPKGGNDFFEGAVVNPDLVLRDLIKIFNPQLLNDQPFVYFMTLR